MQCITMSLSGRFTNSRIHQGAAVSVIIFGYNKDSAAVKML